MPSRSNAIFAGIFVLALVATIVLFTVGTGSVSDPSTSGKLSPEAIEAEQTFKVIQKEWNENEKAFAEAKPEISSRLTGMQEKLKQLNLKMAKMKPASRVETQALPHFVNAVQALQRVVEPYVLRLMAPDVIGPKTAEKVKADTKVLNTEWQTWLELTQEMAR